MTIVNLKEYGLRPVTSKDKVIKSEMASWVVDRKKVESWRVPPFQRELIVNRKVSAIAEEIMETAIISGIITLGDLGGVIYLVDGQHRREAFLMSGLAEAFADVRICQFESMSEMAEEFKRLNSRINAMRPDDILRAEEHNIPALLAIRNACPFVGYNRLSANLSMSVALKAWSGSRGDIPSPSVRGGAGNNTIAKLLEDDEVANIIAFLRIAHAAWGDDDENKRLWGRFNLVLCMWLFRQVVIGNTPASKHVNKLTLAQFQKGLMALSADPTYNEWLYGRKHERDRSPAYARIKAAFVKRLSEEVPGKLRLPQPDWSTSRRV